MGVATAIYAEGNMTQPFLMIYIPGIYEYTGGIRVLIWIVGLLQATGCILLMPPGDVFFFIIASNFPMVADIVQQEMNELSAWVTANRWHAQSNEAKLKFGKYLSLHLKYNGYRIWIFWRIHLIAQSNHICRYIELMDKCFFISCMIQFFTAMAYMILSCAVMVVAVSKFAHTYLYLLFFNEAPNNDDFF